MYVTQGLKRAVQINRDGIATRFGERTRTWGEFGERVARLAGALRGLGLSHEGRVAILALNSDRYLEYYYAVPWAGGIVVPLNIRLAPPEIIYNLNDSGTEILIVDDTFKAMLPAFTDRLDTVQHVVFAGDGETPDGTLSYEVLLGDAAPVADALRGGDDVYGIFYTGGTTGQAKGVMLTHTNIVINAMSVIIGQRYDEHSVYLHAAPMFHLADSGSTFSLTMCAAVHAFIPRFDPVALLQTVQDHRVSHTFLAPTMISMLVNTPAIAEYDLSSLKRIVYGASPMPQALLRRSFEVLPHIEFSQGYGMTELSPVATYLNPEFHTIEGPRAGKLKSAGTAIFCAEVMVVDPHDQEVPRGEIGEIVVRGPMVMKGYWNKPDLTAQAIRNGWMHTGDAGYMDADGFVFVVDRLKDMIITGGENVYSVEVENAIYAHPAVAMCAVIGVPSEEWGEQVHAVVVPKADHALTESEVIEHCRQLIAGYKCPRSVEIRTEPLPISGAGKILKSQIRASHWKGQERQIH